MLFRTRKPKVLIVEDDPHMLDIYEARFIEEGFETAVLKNAEGVFVQKVIDIAPDIISMDIMIKFKDVQNIENGFEAIKILKLDPRTKDIPIIVLSNFFEESKVREAQSVGAVDYIPATGASPGDVPKVFLRYLEDPKHYRPSHPLFRENEAT